MNKLLKLFFHLKKDGFFKTILISIRYVHYLYQKLAKIILLKLVNLRLHKFIDNSVIELLKLKEAFYYLKTTCVHHMNDPLCSSQKLYELNDTKPTIWICWLQGVDSPHPPIVRVCMRSVERFAGVYNIILVTEKNMERYIEIPEHILDKYRKKIIPVAHFSDLLRLLLLITHGGIWLDATVLLTNKIPEIIVNQDIFMFRTSILGNEFLPCSSWFIVAKRNHPILSRVFKVLTFYWKINNNLRHYYLFHIAILLVITYDRESKEMWKNILFKNNSDPHLLQFKLFDKFDSLEKEYIWNLSFVHKLTYYGIDNWDELIEYPGTFYRYIIDDGGCSQTSSLGIASMELGK